MDYRTGIRNTVCALLVAAFVFCAGRAWAQWAKPDGNKQYLLTANEIDYDDQAKTVTALGDAELSDAGTVLQAQSLFYDEDKELVQAHDRIWISQPDGSIMYADEANLTSKFDHGFIKKVGMRMSDDSRLAALQARRIDSRYTIFDKGVFSPCQPCVDNPRAAPLWQVKAKRVTHDNEAHDLIYSDATLDMWGMPLLYIPHFSTPDPSVKRRSGFLAPQFGRNDNVGTFITIPYYYTFSPDFDITFRPTFGTVDGFRWGDTLRKRWEHGEIEVTNSFVIADRKDDDGTTKTDQIRGHIQGFARFDLNNVFRVGSEFALLSDKSYAQRYSEPVEDTLTNRVYLEGLKGRNFGALEFFYFQNNRPGPQPEQPIVLPRLRFTAFGEPDKTLGGRWSFDGLASSLMRDTGASTRKVGLDFGWERRNVLPGGIEATFTGHVRDDVFWVDNLVDPLNTSHVYDNNLTNRLFPVGQAALQYPLAQAYGSVTHIFEPIVSITASPTLDRDPHIANEDSLDVEFDATNLFDINRYPGTDQQEQGTRVAYGIRNAIYADKGGWGEFLLGQSYRITDDPLFPTGTGLDTRFSDYVGELLLDPADWLHVDYLFRLDTKNFEARKHDLKTNFGVPVFRPYVEYTYLNQPVVSTSIPGRVEELKFGFTSNMYKYWTFQFEQTRDLKVQGSGPLVSNIGLAYRDECFTAALTWAHNNTERTDAQGGDSFLFSIYFKHLGGIDAGPK